MFPLMLVQITLYLFISPFLMGYFDNQEYSGGQVFLLFLSFFIVGYKFYYRNNFFKNAKGNNCQLFLRGWLVYLVIFLTILYVWKINSYGLFSRRIGSEHAAEIFSNISFLDILIIRIYEVLLMPYLLVMLYIKKISGRFPLVITLFLIFGFAFSGVIDSRGKLLVFICYCFSIFVWHEFKIKKFFLLLLLILIPISFISISRFDNYNSFKDFILSEFIFRTNGLLIIDKINFIQNIPFFGTFDFYSLKYYSSFLPWLESSVEFKNDGTTSGKNYFLRDILGLNLFDSTTTIINEPYYIFGIPGIVIAGFLWGKIISSFDSAAMKNSLFLSQFKAAMFFSILINFIKFESDFTGVIISFFRDFFILYVGFFGLVFKQKRVT